jgi:calcium-dependent protein kinase
MLCDPDTRFSAEQVLNHTWVSNLAPNSDESLLDLDLQILKNYSNSNKFKKAALTFIASRLKDDEIHKLRDIFFSLDKNNDGTLTFDEMYEGCKSLKSKLDIEEMFDSLDTDKSGKINYTEFIAATIDKKIYLKNERLFEAFKNFDKDGSGKISMKEIHYIINDQKDDYPSIEKEIEKYDLNGDGEIDYEEFCNMMANIKLIE